MTVKEKESGTMRTASDQPDDRTFLQRHRGPIGGIAILIVLFAVWYWLVEAEIVHRVILPPPLDVASAFFTTFTEGFFYEHLWVTLQEVLLGFAIGVILGFGLGAVLGTSNFVREVTYPYIIAFQGLPKIVLAPIFITAFGFGMMSKVMMAAAISFFPLLINTMSGLMTVDSDSVQLMRSLTASKRDIFWKLSVKHAMPSIFAGVKTSLTLALVGAIVGEFVGARAGLGFLLASYSYQLQVDRVWAITLVLAIVGIVLFLFIEWADRKVVFWARRGTNVDVVA
jgi:NitT/TauT family transport system permease protein